MRIGATADLHFFSPRFGVLQHQLAQVRDQADVLVVAGDLPIMASQRKWNPY